MNAAAGIAAWHNAHLSPWVAAQAVALVPAAKLSETVKRDRRRFLRWEDRRFDRALGIQTTGEVRPSTETVADGDPSEGFVYRAQPVRLTRWLLRPLPPASRDFTFIEMGSGEGRACVIAALNGFRSIEGIEFQRGPHEQAVRNVASLRNHSRLPNATITPRLQDAGTYEFPEDPLVVHFSNPFTERVMSRVIGHLIESYERRPRPIFVMYLESSIPTEPTRTRNHELLAELPMFARSRPLLDRGPVESFLLAPWRAFMYETPEALELNG